MENNDIRPTIERTKEEMDTMAVLEQMKREYIESIGEEKYSEELEQYYNSKYWATGL